LSDWVVGVGEGKLEVESWKWRGDGGGGVDGKNLGERGGEKGRRYSIDRNGSSIVN